MPGGDRTGPMGMGPMTGRGTGFCAGYGVPGFVGSGYGPGYGRGVPYGARGGRGRRNRFYATGVPGWQRFFWNRHPYWGAAPFAAPPEEFPDEREALGKQVEYLEESLKELRARMEALASEGKTE